MVSRNRFDPTDSDVDTYGNDTNDPDRLAKVGCQVSEDDGEDDTTKVAHCTSETRHNSIGVGVNVRYKGIVHTIATLEEEGESCKETKHGSLVVRVEQSNGEEETTTDD